MLIDLNLNFGCRLYVYVPEKSLWYNWYNLFILFLFCTEVCPSGGRPESFNSDTRDAFIINKPNVLEETAAQLNSGDSIEITANNNINNTFAVMGLTTTVTGVTKVIYTLYDDENNVIGTPIEVRKYSPLLSDLKSTKNNGWLVYWLSCTKLVFLYFTLSGPCNRPWTIRRNCAPWYTACLWCG